MSRKRILQLTGVPSPPLPHTPLPSFFLSTLPLRHQGMQGHASPPAPPATTSPLTLVRAGSLPSRSLPPQNAPVSAPTYGLALVPVGASARSPPPQLLRGSPSAQMGAVQSGEPEAVARIQRAGAPRRAQRGAAPPRPSAPTGADADGQPSVKTQAMNALTRNAPDIGRDMSYQSASPAPAPGLMGGSDLGRDMSYRSPAPFPDGGQIGKDMSYYSPASLAMPAPGGRDMGSDLYGSSRSVGSTRGR